ncbi:glycosyl hydrolase family 28-related protein [Paenibacillus sp. YIM B09110]|uniref:glycosyl hydrolase family 28-related protein n=1 Tax=Paenibacillus sp. YIM B09110 TaxID=3126102 RepID=UPI00301BADD5
MIRRIQIVAFAFAAIATFVLLYPYNQDTANAEIPYTVNVLHVGAKGDGKSNDSKAFATALRKVSENKNGGVVLVPKGEYLIDIAEPLYVRSNVSIVGQSKPVLTFKNFSATDSFGYEGFDIRGSNITINGLKIDAGFKLIRGIGIHSNAKNIKVINSVIQNITQSKNPNSSAYEATVSGILVYGGTSDITIDKNVIRNIYAFNADPVARGIMVYAEDDLPYAQRVKITNNYISNIKPRDDADGIYFDMPEKDAVSSGSIVDSNTITHVAKRGIKISVQGVTVSKNHITNVYLNNNNYMYPKWDAVPQDMFAGISVYASNVVVRDNVIDGVGSYYAGIEADLGDLRNIAIYNNTISNGAKANIKNTNGIRLGSINSFKVHGNNITNMQTGIFSPVTDTQVGTIKTNTIDKIDFGIRFTLYTEYKNSKVVVSNNVITARKLKIEALPD